MYCKKCGKPLSDELHYCPNCGTKSDIKINKTEKTTHSTERVNSQHRGKLLLIVVVISVVMVVGVFWVKPSVLEDRNNNIEIPNSTSIERTTERMTTAANIESACVIGTWKCEAGEVTFTEKGHMMLGKDGIALGGGWLQYEIVDDSTLYLSGGDMPIGINMKYELDGDYLGLELNGETIVFYKEQ